MIHFLPSQGRKVVFFDRTSPSILIFSLKEEESFILQSLASSRWLLFYSKVGAEFSLTSPVQVPHCLFLGKWGVFLNWWSEQNPRLHYSIVQVNNIEKCCSCMVLSQNTCSLFHSFWHLGSYCAHMWWTHLTPCGRHSRKLSSKILLLVLASLTLVK